MRRQHSLLPRCFFSGRSLADGSDLLANGNGRTETVNTLLSVAGVRSALVFRRLRQFSYNDWKSIKSVNTSSEWEAFGAFYFMVRQEVLCLPQLLYGMMTSHDHRERPLMNLKLQ